MPFVARCKRCNFLMFAIDRKTIREIILEHVEKSHNWEVDDEQDMTIMVISHEQYRKLKALAKNPKFWEAYRKSRKLFV